ncbi:aldehyde dehydrogenase family protein [Allopusillimonas soli]|uniref:Aldehyde dehydrogenase family protein n=1 Tax=Allopusillimonas soli TaxID=659016 RepID=A0A853F8W2_9BURK|nr:aldehyde dehydrogenase family protein [Allopusillimonas soli]NYT36022.1 aldehyde dehydrogenase family protein [Allopusillimonas soli]TEA76365.1 aldehyde dehydrogenase family protein [Allopusillimonas soli]
MTSQYGNLIDGEWVSTPEVNVNINPSDTDDVVGRYARGGRDDAVRAIEAARRAFPAWARSVPLDRHDMLMRASAEVLARADDLGRLLAREEGKTLVEGVGEARRAGQVLAFMAGESLRIGGERIQGLAAGSDAEVTREPLGVVAVITPWNFPIAIPAWKIGAALAYGNCVVFKPAELVPGCAWALTDILHRAGVPRGVLNLVMGSGSKVGAVFAEHEDVDAMTFTGSVPTGRAIAAACVAGPTMKRMQLEMGGKNPLVVLDDADLDNAVECAVNGAFYSAGQRCTASSRLIVTAPIHDRFVNAVIQRLKSLRIGHALDPENHIGPVVDQRQLDIDLSYLDIGQRENARLAWGGDRLQRPTPGFYLQPALFTDVEPGMRIAREEIFGPVATVLKVKDYEEALAVANDTEFGLSAGICTTSLKYASHFKRNSEAGIVKVNQGTSGLDFHLPFGGRKASSYGPREQGRYAAEFYTIVKTSYTSPGQP